MAILGDFLNQYRAKTTRAMYMSAWVKFLSLHYGARLKGASPEVLEPWVAKYVNDVRNGRRDPAADLRALGESLRTPRTRLAYQSAIRALLAEADIPLSPKGARRLRRAPRGSRPAAGAETLTPAMVLRLMEHLDTRGRAILYILASSGALPGEVLSMEQGDLDLDSRPARFRIRKGGRGETRVAFISREAVGAIRVYLIVRDRFLASARSRGGTAAAELLFPLGTRAFEQVWALALAKARLERFNPVTGRRTLTPLAMRRFFAERMGTVLPESVVAAMMSGTGRPGEPAGRFAEEELARAYLGGEPAITLHRSHRRTKVAAKVAELERLLAQLQEKVGETDRELAHIRESIQKGREEGQEAYTGEMEG